jgi:putative glycosyltransferase (TIGR04372 family)
MVSPDRYGMAVTFVLGASVGSVAAAALMLRREWTMGRLKRSVKEWIKRTLPKLPGGKSIYPLAKWMLWFYRRVRLQLLLSPTGRLVYRGEKLLGRNQLDAGLRLFDRALERNPNHAKAMANRASALYLMGKGDAACEELNKVWEQVPAKQRDQCFPHGIFAELLVARGEVERAVGHWLEHLRQCSPTANTQTSASGLSAAIGRPDVQFEGMNDLAEHILNQRADFREVMKVYTARHGLQESFARQYGLDKLRTLVLPDDWARNIGHTAYMEYWVKLARLGWGPWDHLVVLAEAGKAANPAYLDYWRDHFTIVTDPVLRSALTPLAAVLGSRVATSVTLPGHGEVYFCEALGCIQEEWEKRGHGALLSLADSHRQKGRELLRQMGVPADAWFVTVHTRQSGYHREGDNLSQGHRNSRIGDYTAAIRAIVERGGWVIRLGDPTMEPLPPMKHVVDYAHRPEKSPSMDIFLCGESRFFVGTASGLCHVPFTFGVPCALTNWISNAMPPYSSDILFIPKLLVQRTEQRMLSFAEALSRQVRDRCYCAPRLKAGGLDWVDNTAEEIRDLVVEMLDRFEGKADFTAQDRRLQAEFRRIADAQGVLGCARVGKAFLQQYRHLLRDHEDTTGAFDRAHMEAGRVAAAG